MKKKSFLHKALNRMGLSTASDLKAFHNSLMMSIKGYQGATLNRLVADWQATNTDADAELRGRLCLLRNRCRELERNNDYVARYLGELEANVLGQSGITMQMRIVEPAGNGKTKPDYLANKIIETAYAEWSQKKNCTTSRQLSLHEVEKLVLRSTARDGDCMIRMVKGFDNDFGFALQLFEADYLNETYNAVLPNKHIIKMGVEFDEWQAPVAYWMFTEHPGSLYQMAGNLRMIRVSADEIILPFVRHRIGQSRGEPWMVTTMLRLKMLAAYEEAELVKVRASSCKMGFYEKDFPEDMPADNIEGPRPIAEASPGLIEELPMGVKFKGWDPTATDANYPDFRKGVLRGIAAGLQVSYNMLAQDLEGVNFSSLRGGLLDEREMWMMLQGWFIEQVKAPIFEAWLPMAILSGKIKLPMSKLDKFSAVQWKGRRWAWVDPEKDVDAALKAIAGRIKSRSDIIAENGGDLEDTFDRISMDEEIADEKGIYLPEVEEQKKIMLDQYGIGGRAGVISANLEDEKHMRDKLGLPKVSKEVEADWKEEPVRMPTALQMEQVGYTPSTGKTLTAPKKQDGNEES